MLFAPFFAGAAGPGQIWHWDVYVDRNDLWRSSGASQRRQGPRPAAETLQPRRLEHPRLRLYALAGPRTLLLWCRDGANTWRTELEEGKAPERLADLRVDLAPLLGARRPARARVYDPWREWSGTPGGAWSEVPLAGASLRLPPFSRSLVVRIELR